LTPVAFLVGRVTLHPGDCLDVLAGLPENSVDSVVTDPPYHLTSIVKRFGADGAAPAQFGKDGAYARASAGFMGKKWDGGDVAFRSETWAAVLRVMKPGAHLLAFSGTRTYHRMVCAIEDAGFEIRDQIAWVYGSGFPKSHDVSKGIDRMAGAEREIVGGSSVTSNRKSEVWRDGSGFDGNINHITAPATDAARQWQGWGSALKPSFEPIVLARKPLTGTIAGNVLKWGTGAINIDGTRIATDPSVDDARLGGAGAWTTTQQQSGDTVSLPRGVVASSPLGRFPANLIHDGSEEVLAAFPETASGAPGDSIRNSKGFSGIGDSGLDKPIPLTGFGDSGSAARFFYSAKADSLDRLGSKHPTVKPLDLMQYLCRLITPPGGTVLDLFAGTGTTGEAAWREGFNAILIEREPEYQADIARRMDLAVKPTKRAAVAKTKGKLMGAEGTPLFGDEAA
jgi:DNA modification methylase